MGEEKWIEEARLKEQIRNGSIMNKKLFDVLKINGAPDIGNVLKFDDFLTACKVLTGYTNQVNTVYPSVKISLKNAELQLKNMKDLSVEKKTAILTKFNEDGIGDENKGGTVKRFYDTFSGVSVENRILNASVISEGIKDIKSTEALEIEIRGLRKIVEQLNFDIIQLTQEKNKLANERDRLLTILYPPPPPLPQQSKETTSKTKKAAQTMNIKSEKNAGIIDEEELTEVEEEKEEEKEDEWLKTSMNYKNKNIYNNPDIPTCFQLSNMKVNLNDIIESIEKKTNSPYILKDEYFSAVCNSLSK